LTAAVVSSTIITEPFSINSPALPSILISFTSVPKLLPALIFYSSSLFIKINEDPPNSIDPGVSSSGPPTG
jgi:hypothetical protein